MRSIFGKARSGGRRGGLRFHSPERKRNGQETEESYMKKEGGLSTRLARLLKRKRKGLMKKVGRERVKRSGKNPFTSKKKRKNLSSESVEQSPRAQMIAICFRKETGSGRGKLPS